MALVKKSSDLGIWLHKASLKYCMMALPKQVGQWLSVINELLGCPREFAPAMWDGEAMTAATATLDLLLLQLECVKRNTSQLLELAKTEEEEEWAALDSNSTFTMQNVSTYGMVFVHVLTR